MLLSAACYPLIWNKYSTLLRYGHFYMTESSANPAHAPQEKSALSYSKPKCYLHFSVEVFQFITVTDKLSRASIFLYYSSILHVFPFLSPITCMFIFLTNPDGWHTFWEQDLKCGKDLYAFKDLIVISLLVTWSLKSKFHLILVTEQPWKCSWGLCLQLDRTSGHDQGLKINHSSLLKLEGGYLAVFLEITKGGWLSGWMGSSWAEDQHQLRATTGQSQSTQTCCLCHYLAMGWWWNLSAMKHSC